MANWYGKARSNYVRFKDVAALRRAIEPFEIDVQPHPSRPEFFGLFPTTEDGDFPSCVYDHDDGELEFSFSEHVVPYLAEGQVLVVQCIGSEKLRYLTGYATAFAWDGRTSRIDIGDIVAQAAQDFGVNPKSIAHPTFQDLPLSEDALSEDAPVVDTSVQATVSVDMSSSEASGDTPQRPRGG